MCESYKFSDGKGKRKVWSLPLFFVDRFGWICENLRTCYVTKIMKEKKNSVKEEDYDNRGEREGREIWKR